jgi:hypothetical protein
MDGILEIEHLGKQTRATDTIIISIINKIRRQNFRHKRYNGKKQYIVQKRC